MHSIRFKNCMVRFDVWVSDITPPMFQCKGRNGIIYSVTTGHLCFMILREAPIQAWKDLKPHYCGVRKLF